MSKSFFFFGRVFGPDDGHRRITIDKSRGIRVDGGSKEDHEQAVELTREVSREVEKDPPQTQGELNCIVRDVAKKVGMLPREKK